MKATVRDRQALITIEPEDITTYLLAHGWRQEVGGRDNAALWFHGDGEGDSEILVPLAANLDDYPTRLAQVLSVLERVEGRSQLGILRDINLAGTDVVRVRAPHADTKLGSVPLRRGAELVERTMDIMAAVASTAVAPRRVIPSRRPAQAEQFLQAVQLGQSEKGSYVITILSRIEALRAGDSIDLFQFPVADVPFPRLVTRTLASALEATKTATAAASEGSGVQVFLEAVKSGVSANLCEALAALLQGTAEADRLDLSIMWAPRMPEQRVGSFHFRQGEAAVLLEAARYLREEAPEQGILVHGVVIKLHREEDAADGTATIACFIGRSLRKLLVPLGTGDYELAIEAHRTQRAVSFRTDIGQVGRQYRATNVQDFRILD